MSEYKLQRVGTRSKVWSTALMTGAVAFVAIGALSCEQPFDPRGPLDPHMAVFTVLSTDRNLQFVRVTAPFMPAEYGSASLYGYDNTLTDATVDVSRSAFIVYEGFKRLYPAEHHPARDTLLARPEGSPYTYPLHLYATAPFTVEYGKQYDVTVSSKSHGNAAMSVVIPGKPSIQMYPLTYFMLQESGYYKPTDTIGFKLTLSDLAKGFVARLYANYQVYEGAEWVDERIEVPILWADTTYSSLAGATFPKLRESMTTKGLNVVWPWGNLQGIFHLAFLRWGGKGSYKGVALYLLQTDANLYSYSIADQVNGDPRSIRLDQPLYPTTSGGNYGMVGAYTLDSLVYTPSSIISGSQR